MSSKNRFLFIIDSFVFVLIIFILSVFIKVSAAEAWPRARDAKRRTDLMAVGQAIDSFKETSDKSLKAVPFVNQNNSSEQEKNYSKLMKLLIPEFIESTPQDPLGSKSPQQYGYLAMEIFSYRVASEEKYAKNFRLGAYSENTSDNYHYYNLTTTPVTGNISYP